MDKSMKITIRKTLELIEDFAMYKSDDDKNMAQIYMWAHTALSPNCRKNHKSWTEDLIKNIRRNNVRN